MGVRAPQNRLSFADLAQYNRSVFIGQSGARLLIRGSVFIATLCLAQSARPQSQPAAVLNKYCVTCHNDRLKTGGLVLNPAELTRAAAGAETWEKVIQIGRAHV